jgi:molecular chaperone GrpE
MADKHSIDPAERPAAAAPPDSPDAAAAVQAEADDIAALKRERDDLYDRLLRKTAEFDNYRKRIDRERRQQADETVAHLLLELLLIVDDFERALAAEAPDEAGPYKKGVELIHAKIHDLLSRHGVRPIEALGAGFDPNVHQAVTYEASPEHRDGEVIGELRRGYMLGDRLLRPAMVKVAKA